MKIKIKNYYKFVFFAFFIFLIKNNLHATKVLSGDSSATSGLTFSNSILSNTICVGQQNTMFVARSVNSNNVDSDEIKSFSLAGVNFEDNTFIAYSPLNALVNNVAMNNPLYGERIALLTSFNGYPAVVKYEELNCVYAATHSLGSDQAILLKSDILKDANGSNIGTISALTDGGKYIFAAVSSASASFGRPGSGIAVIKRSSNGLEQIASQLGSAEIRSTAIDDSSSFLKIGNNNVTISSMNNVVLRWDELLQRLYVGLTVYNGVIDNSTSYLNATAGDGIKSICMGYFDENEKLILIPVVNDTVVDNGSESNMIIGKSIAGVNNGIVGNISFLDVMHTSIGLSYLIGIGNVKKYSNIDRSLGTTVFALPLIDKKANDEYSFEITAGNSWIKNVAHGAIADVTTMPQSFFKLMPDGRSYVSGRAFQNNAISNSFEKFRSNNFVNSKVGGSDAFGFVTQMRVVRDRVFISIIELDTTLSIDNFLIGTNINSSKSTGIYSSQALFDENGIIVNWTKWERILVPSDFNNLFFNVVNLSSQQIFGFVCNASTNQVMTVSGDSKTNIKKVMRTDYSIGAKNGLLGGTSSDESLGLVKQFELEFPKNTGGIYGLFNFPFGYSGLNNNENTGLSLLIATGYKKIMLVQSGYNYSGNFVAQIGDFLTNKIQFSQGEITSTIPDNTIAISISGGVLNKIGAITSAEIASDSVNGYVIIGGVGGLAILRSANYSGWNMGNPYYGLRKNFSGLNSGMSFQLIGSFTHVRKIINTGICLFILTDNALYRMPLGQLASENPIATVIASLSELQLNVQHASFADCIVSDKLALLATSEGLYRTSNNVNVNIDSVVRWTKIALPRDNESVTKLIPITQTGFHYDFARNYGGMVYALSSSAGKNRSSLYRLSIKDVSPGSVSDTSVQLLPDLYEKNVAESFFTYDNNLSAIHVDGNVIAISYPSLLEKPLFFGFLPSWYSLGNSTYMRSILKQDLSIDHGSVVRGIVRNSGTGSLMMYGDFGVRVLE